MTGTVHFGAHMEEQQKIQHQVELATRFSEIVRDEPTAQRLRSFADELRQKLARMIRRPRIKARAYELWEAAGRPAGRDVEFWLEAERQIGQRKESE